MGLYVVVLKNSDYYETVKSPCIFSKVIDAGSWNILSKK